MSGAVPGPGGNGLYRPGGLWTSWPNRLLTLLLAAALLAVLPGLADWALGQAVWRPDAEACRALQGRGACWGVVAEKWRVILFGRYPADAWWRPAAGTALLLGALVLAAGGRGGWWRRALLATGGLAACVVLLAGGLPGLAPVAAEQWGGLPLTLLLAVTAMALALPLGLALALGRRGPWPVLRTLCAAYIELLRGLPLVPVLFMAAFLFPLFLPRAWGGNPLLRVLLALVLFAAAYLAEIIRGGLQAIPASQEDCARALGLGAWQVQRQVLLPQALTAALPALVNSFIALFKDVSLVTVVSLHELTGSLTLALAGDAQWRAFYLEGYVFVGLIYWLGCFALSHFGRRLERRR